MSVEGGERSEELKMCVGRTDLVHIIAHESNRLLVLLLQVTITGTAHDNLISPAWFFFWITVGIDKQFGQCIAAFAFVCLTVEIALLQYLSQKRQSKQEEYLPNILLNNYVLYCEYYI